MGRFQPARAVTSQYPSLDKSLDSGADVVKMLSKLGVIRSDSIVLQIGCGIGRVELHLYKHVHFCYGIDVAPSMIDRARRNVHASNVCFVRASHLAELPFRSCDLIYAIFVFQHLPRRNMIEYVKESYALLTPGGTLVFQILVDDLKAMPEPPRMHPYGLRYYRRAELSALLTDVGYREARFFSFPDAEPDSGTDGDLLVVASKPNH
jgi:SAM-dependent methyltransferase